MIKPHYGFASKCAYCLKKKKFIPVWCEEGPMCISCQSRCFYDSTDEDWFKRRDKPLTGKQMRKMYKI